MLPSCTQGLPAEELEPVPRHERLEGPGQLGVDVLLVDGAEDHELASLVPVVPVLFGVPQLPKAGEKALAWARETSPGRNQTVPPPTDPPAHR